jgi:flavin-dependent dehydrogenase
MNNGGALKSGANIAVIGGGPAGSFFAILALKIAREMGKDINILIFDCKHFSDHGPRGCNMCAGVIQDSLIKKLEGIGITLPSDIRRADIEGYAFHLKGLSACIKKDPSTSIYSVFRGAGPYRWSMIPMRKVSFDQYLLDHAIKEGVKFRYERVSGIEFPKMDGNKVSVICKGKNNNKVYEADFVVGAFGVNTILIKKLPFGYQPPKMWISCQAEIEMERDHLREKCSNMIHIFFTRSPKIKYLAITPKGDNATITAIGKNVSLNDLQNEIINSEISKYLPSNWEFTCHCHPKLPVTPSRQPYTDRCVVIGDASY